MLSLTQLVAAAAVLSATPALGQIERIDIPPSRQSGLDMILIDEDSLPPEPELATHAPEAQDERWIGAPIEPPTQVHIHPIYSELREQLDLYKSRWGQLPQVRIPAGAAMAISSTDPRLAVLRERLGLPPAGSFDKALTAKLTAYQKAHGLAPDGKAGPSTIASLNQGVAYYEALILLNMERARRLPAAKADSRYVLVDAGSARLWMYEGGKPVDSMKVVVGSPATETPMMAAPLRFSSVNPYWNVPADLAEKLIAPRVLAGGLTYLSDRGYEVLDGWAEDAPLLDPASVDWKDVAEGGSQVRVRQLPGGGNSMGEIKFMMPNEYGIYLHDTPNKALFAQDERWVSNGCVRVEDARRLARWLHGEMPRGSSASREERVDLEAPVPVYITYFTVGAATDGLEFRQDRYGRDASVLRRFNAGASQMVDRDEEFRKAMGLEDS